MNIVIVTKDTFPFGMASTQRISLLSKAILQNNKNNVLVMCIRVPGKEFVHLDIPPKGIHNNVNFEYSTGRTARSKFFIIRRLVEFFSGVHSLIKS